MSLERLAIANSIASHADLPPDGRKALALALSSPKWTKYAQCRKKYESALRQLIVAPPHLFTESHKRCCALRLAREKAFEAIPGASHLVRYYSDTKEYLLFFAYTKRA